MRSSGIPWLLVVLTPTGCGQTVEAELPRRLIASTTVDYGASTRQTTLSGVVEDAVRADASFEVAGPVASMRVDVGDAFEAGELLATLDRSTFALRLRERVAAVARARAEHERARLDYDRYQQMLSDGSVTQAAADGILAQYQASSAQLELATATLALAEKASGDTRLTAPYAGTVTARHVEPGEQVAPGQSVLSLQRRDAAPEVSVAVPETLIAQLELGSSHRVAFPARPELAVRGVVSQIGRKAVAAAFPVTLVLQDPPPEIWAGMTAKVHFSFEAERGLSIPLTALIPGTGEEERYVAFVYDRASGAVQRRAIRIDSVDADRAIIGAGLTEGEVVATRGLSFLRDGQRVALLNEGPARFDPPPRQANAERSSQVVVE